MTESNESKNEPIIRVTLDLVSNGVKSVVVRADTAEGRDEALVSATVFHFQIGET